MIESPPALRDDDARPGDPSVPARLDEPVVVKDPRMIRALAHPARITALHHLYAGEELTAHQCAALVGIATSAMTYHLRALERWGLVCVRPGRTEVPQRDDVWCACGSSLEVRPGDSIAARTAQTAVHHSLVELLRADLAGGLAQTPAEAPASGFTVVPLLLTDAEAAELGATVMALLERFGQRSAAAPT
jgi:DNA-binding transcriptional ArsR family regulator